MPASEIDAIFASKNKAELAALVPSLVEPAKKKKKKKKGKATIANDSDNGDTARGRQTVERETTEIKQVQKRPKPQVVDFAEMESQSRTKRAKFDNTEK